MFDLFVSDERGDHLVGYALLAGLFALVLRPELGSVFLHRLADIIDALAAGLSAWLS